MEHLLVVHRYLGLVVLGLVLAHDAPEAQLRQVLAGGGDGDSDLLSQ
jgi:hypothetical protein